MHRLLSAHGPDASACQCGRLRSRRARRTGRYGQGRHCGTPCGLAQRVRGGHPPNDGWRPGRSLRLGHRGHASPAALDPAATGERATAAVTGGPVRQRFVRLDTWRGVAVRQVTRRPGKVSEPSDSTARRGWSGIGRLPRWSLLAAIAIVALIVVGLASALIYWLSKPDAAASWNVPRGQDSA